MSTMPSQSDYDARERRQFQEQLADVLRAPLVERQDARKEYKEALILRPGTVAERIGWLLAGNYGYGSYAAALDVMASPRMNHAAWLGQTIAALEWHCPPDFARQAYVSLTTLQKAVIDAAIADEITAWRKDQQAEAVN